jgi:GLPGLI family protein
MIALTLINLIESAVNLVWKAATLLLPNVWINSSRLKYFNYRFNKTHYLNDHYMKRVQMQLMFLMITVPMLAQVKEGRIVYERKINMHKGISAENESMKNMIPEFSVSKVELLFNGEETIYKQLPEENDIRESAGETGERMMIRFGGGENEVYKNHTTGRIVELRELGPRKYIIEDSIRRMNWKLTEETKTISGFSCKKAVTSNQRKLPVVAWYTEQIPYAGGPENFGGLPGMILELNVAEGEVVFTPVEIKSSVDKNVVKVPVNGKKISRKEFDKMMEDQFGPRPEGGGPVIRIRQNRE